MEESLHILYADESIVVGIKPAGILSTDEPGGMPELVRASLGDTAAEVRTVHRLDRVVSGLMVLARSAASASELSRQIREGTFEKAYLSVVHGKTQPDGILRDLLLRNRFEGKTYVTAMPAKGVQEAILNYTTLGQTDALSLVKIHLQTGRTHQIRVQFSSRGFPIVGDRKYNSLNESGPMALWSYSLRFTHPLTGEKLLFFRQPPWISPWCLFGDVIHKESEG